ncbi:MAG: TatD family hydrolase [Ignisphaera sp.]|uniref:TatD family deoxyribonuclease n=1 Tax=Ignisphaera aggregans TaxID=334771 RepID=A0A7J3MZM3_9CREN
MVDAHCHIHEFPNEEIKDIGKLVTYLIAVSDDHRSSIRTLDLAKRYRWIIPSVGLHPWSVDADSIDEAKKISDLAREKGNEIRILGEVGLDKRFKQDTYHHQLKVFEIFIELAKEMNMILNIHAAGAWREVLNILAKNDIPMAIIHWYTGPLELIKEINDRGYLITVNPTIAIQQKQRDVIAQAPIDLILVESDAPYKYKGLELHPKHIPNVIKHIAMIKKISEEEVHEAISRNIYKLLKHI